MTKKHKTLVEINIPQNMAELSGLFNKRCRKILNVIGAQIPDKIISVRLKIKYIYIFLKKR
jgi:hypothetical protein